MDRHREKSQSISPLLVYFFFFFYFLSKKPRQRWRWRWWWRLLDVSSELRSCVLRSISQHQSESRTQQSKAPDKRFSNGARDKFRSSVVCFFFYSVSIVLSSCHPTISPLSYQQTSFFSFLVDIFIGSVRRRCD